MNKFILVLLIAVASCVTVEFDGSNLEGFWDWIKSVWGSIENFFKDIPGYLKEIYDKLKNEGYIEQLLELVNKYGKPKAVEICTNWTGKNDLCTDIVDFIFGLLE